MALVMKNNLSAPLTGLALALSVTLVSNQPSQAQSRQLPIFIFSCGLSDNYPVFWDNTTGNNPSPRTESKPVTLANTPPNNPSATNEPTPAIFQKLESLLQAGKWRDADLETWELMKKLTKREQEGWLRVEDVKNFPRQELRKMDQLWVKYSNGKFGFSVQKQIWLDLGGKLDGKPDYDTYVKLGDRVGWRKNDTWLSYDSYTFSTNALRGHLPVSPPGVAGGVLVFGERLWVFTTLFSSLDYNP
jgi:hypothetical protein